MQMLMPSSPIRSHTTALASILKFRMHLACGRHAGRIDELESQAAQAMAEADRAARQLLEVEEGAEMENARLRKRILGLEDKLQARSRCRWINDHAALCHHCLWD